MADQTSGSEVRRPRVPESCAGIQVNHCKNPVCANFRLPRLNNRNDPRYTRVGANKQLPKIGQRASSIASSIRCKGCGETISLKSNQGINETIKILTWRPEAFSCSNNTCENNRADLESSPLLGPASGLNPLVLVRPRTAHAGIEGHEHARRVLAIEPYV